MATSGFKQHMQQVEFSWSSIAWFFGLKIIVSNYLDIISSTAYPSDIQNAFTPFFQLGNTLLILPFLYKILMMLLRMVKILPKTEQSQNIEPPEPPSFLQKLLFAGGILINFIGIFISLFVVISTVNIKDPDVGLLFLYEFFLTLLSVSFLSISFPIHTLGLLLMWLPLVLAKAKFHPKHFQRASFTTIYVLICAFLAFLQLSSAHVA